MIRRHCAPLFVLILIAAPATRSRCADAPALPATAAELFIQDKVWTAHLTVAADAWQSMEPKGGGGPRFVGGRGEGPEPGAVLAAAMFKRADANKDGRVDASEFRALASRWFDRWDVAGAGALDVVQLAAGVNGTLDPEGLSQGAAFQMSLRGPEGKGNGLAAVFGWDYTKVSARLTFAGVDLKDVGLRYKGNGTFMHARTSIKRPLKVDLNASTGGQALAGVTKLNFHNNVSDPSAMAESIAYRLYREADVPAPRTTYVKVNVTVPGKHDNAYFGLYSIVENVDGQFLKDRFGSKHGAIFKPATIAPFADLGDEWADYKQTYDPKTEVTVAQTQRVIDLARLVSRADDAKFAARIGQFVDVDEVARYMAVTVFLSTLDSILYSGQNYYLYLDPKSGRFQIIPWDLDHSFGALFGDPAELTKLSIRKPWVGPNRFFERLFKVEAFERAYTARLGEFARTIFKPDALHAQVDTLAVAIRPAIEVESKEKVASFDRAIVAGAAPPPVGFLPSRPVWSIKRFVDARVPSIVDQLAGKSQGVPAKGMGMWGQNRDTGGPGRALAPGLLCALDAEKDGRVRRVEVLAGFDRWFKAWDVDGDGLMSKQEIEAGVGKDIAPPKPRGLAGWLIGGATTRSSTRPAGG